ncbi:MAG: carboxypeptidase-like regulatory domain-containing protein, partial [Verrucomicrobiales bacterium]|nr:carboxypeptidase-like regulatory domain-containing protein [Verrucomicrobiales bacterium]
MKAMKVLAVLFCIAVAVSGVPALAQVQAGRIVGTVYDPADAVVPGATVTVTNTNTNVAHSVTSNSSGDFVVTPLNPGVYDVSAALQGFQTTIDRGVELLVGQTVRLDLRLAIGETTTVLEVTAEVPLLNTDTGTVGQVISNKQITDLPLNGRGFHELARLTPGAATVSATGNVLRIRPEVVNSNTISGVRGSQITFLLDGADVTEQHQGGTYIQASIDALQEFSVQQNAYSAEFSRAGGFFNATTKSGTNEFHGALFEFLRNDKLDARGFFARDREILKRNQYGGAIGGRIFRDKTFFFVNYEAMRERVGLLFNNIVPSLAQRNGDFSRAGLNRIYDPLSQVANPAGGGAIRTQFTNNTIPQNQLSPQAVFFNDFIVQPNTGVDRAVFSPSRSVDTDQITARVDHQLGNSTLFGRLSWHDNRMQEPNAHPTLGIAPLNTDAQNVAIGLNTNLRPTVVNEFRFNFLPSLIDLAPYLDRRDFNAEAGITGFENILRRDGSGSFPDFTWTGYAGLRGSSFDQRPKT